MTDSLAQQWCVFCGSRSGLLSYVLPDGCIAHAECALAAGNEALAKHAAASSTARAERR